MSFAARITVHSVRGIWARPAGRVALWIFIRGLTKVREETRADNASPAEDRAFGCPQTQNPPENAVCRFPPLPHGLIAEIRTRQWPRSQWRTASNAVNHRSHWH